MDDLWGKISPQFEAQANQPVEQDLVVLTSTDGASIAHNVSQRVLCAMYKPSSSLRFKPEQVLITKVTK